MDGSLFVGLDVGTSAVRACAFDAAGTLVAAGAHRLVTSRVHGVGAEQDATQWGEGAVSALRAMVARLGNAAARVEAIGLTGQCPSFTLLDSCGQPATGGLLYADNRGVVEAGLFAQSLGGQEAIWERTGQWAGAFYVAPKLMWLAAHALPESRPLTMAQPRDVIGLRLTGRLATDDSHANCTLLYDLWRRDWIGAWIARLDLGWAELPPVLHPWDVVGTLCTGMAAEVGLAAGLPVVIGGADSCSTALGVGAVCSGVVSDASGSSTCLDFTVAAPLRAAGVSTYAHVLPGLWCADTGMNATGTVLAWAADVLAGGDVGRLEALASSAPPGCEGLLFSPYLAGGERADPSAIGAWINLSLRHGQTHLARSVFEGLTFGLRIVLDRLRAAGCTVEVVHVSGGGARSGLWNSLKAQVFGVQVVAAEPQAAALGAAMLGGLSVRRYESGDDAVSHCVRPRDTSEPDAGLVARYEELFATWHACMLAATAVDARGVGVDRPLDPRQG